MQAVEGVITLIQEGRFELVTDGGRVMHFMLAHGSSVEPQDLPPLQQERRRVRVEYTKPTRVVTHVAHTLRTADRSSSKGIGQ
ncbi:MAG: hypothetical protein JO320_27775 [Alphaproteobacteria bacterium]|nr:hypothetical protein [Alphaproteobacteria bacterium]